MTDLKHPLPTGANDETRTVTLTHRDVEEAKRLLALLAGPEERNTAAELARIALETGPGPRERLVRSAREILLARQRRVERFGPAMFGEPAWEMLLLLYVSDGAARLTSTRLAELCGNSQAAASRWLDHLVDQDLVAKDPHPAGCVGLTDKGRVMLDAYLADSAALTA